MPSHVARVRSLPATLAVAIGALLIASVLACPAPSGEERRSQKAEGKACEKAGDRCEFAPGKIGLCTAKPEGCDGVPCLTCVSLH